MIEVIYKDEEKGNDNISTGSAVRLPKNVTQIGQGDGNGRFKVYVENQVIKDIKRRSDEGVLYGVLLGKREKDDVEYVFINNIIEIKNNQENIILFNDDIWLYIYDEVKKRGYEGDIVGWYVNFPENRMKNLGHLKKLHLDNFAGINKLLFCYEEENEEDGVYIYNNNILEKQPVYYIYWGKSKVVKHQDSKQTDIKEKIPTEKSENNIRKMPWGSVAVIAVLVGVLAFMGNSGMLNSLTDRAKALIENSSSDKLPVVDDVGAENQTTTETPTKNEEMETTLNDEETTKEPETDETTVNDEETTLNNEETTTEKQDDDVSNQVSGTEYIVKQGETLYDISRSFYGTLEMVQKIIEANNIENPDKILAGQKLILPDK